ncbi:MAG: SulP family inorganic anion transporter [Cyclobacteriaceae bacterium]
MKVGTETLKGDIFGGISAGIVALPVALAFGAAAGMEPINGLYGAIVLGILAAIFGGTNTLISNPTGPMAVVTLSVVTSFTGIFGDGNIMPYLIVTFFAAGAIQLLFGVLKLGKYVHYIPHPVISGFMSGIGLIIILGQFNSFFGISSGQLMDSFGVKKLNSLETVKNVWFYISNANYVNVLLALSTILIIRLFPIISKKIPSTLVALLMVSCVSVLLGLKTKIIGDIPTDIPSIDFQSFTQIDFSYTATIIEWAIFLGALGMIDSLLTSVVADKLTKTKHKSNKELIGQGIGNMVSALIGGMPGAGTTPATVLNINSGGRTKLSGIIHGVFLVLILFVFAPVAKHIPYAVLAGVLINVGLSILDYSAVRQFKNVPKQDNIVMIIVLLMTVFWSLLYAVAIGLIISALIFMKKMADVVELESRNTKIDRLINGVIESFDNSIEFRENVLIKNMRGPLFFGFASRFQDSIHELDQIKAVIFNMSGVTYMDQSGLYTLRDAVEELHEKNTMVCLSECREDHESLLRSNDIVPDMIGEEFIFSSIEENIMWLNEPGHVDGNFDYEDQLYIPSAYTPNGDGINDEWEIKNIDKYPNCIVKIKNREGTQIFESKGYKEMWEGIYKGEMLPVDKYFYEIDLGVSGEEIRTGTVMIFR